MVEVCPGSTTAGSCSNQDLPAVPQRDRVRRLGAACGPLCLMNQADGGLRVEHLPCGDAHPIGILTGSIAITVMVLVNVSPFVVSAGVGPAQVLGVAGAQDHRSAVQSLQRGFHYLRGLHRPASDLC